MDLALNNQQRLICHKIQPTNRPKPENFGFSFEFRFFWFLHSWIINVHDLFNTKAIFVQREW